MQSSILPSDLYSELIEHMPLQDINSFCSTSSDMIQYCNKKEILNQIKNKINTSYNSKDFNFKQLMLFGKTNLLWKNMAIYEDTAIYIKNNNFMIYDLITGNNANLSTLHLLNIKMGNLQVKDIYQFAIRKLIKSLHLLMLMCISNDGKIYILSSGTEPKTLPLSIKIISIHNDAENKQGVYVIDQRGKLLESTAFGSFSPIEFKNVIQLEDQFILNVDGEVYIKIINGNIYNPLTQKYINHDSSFKIFNETKYYKIMNNVKQIHTLGYFLSNDHLYKFNWDLMTVNVLPYENVDKFECYIKNNSIYIVWLSEGILYIDNEQISNPEYYVTEVHISLNKLIYIDNENINNLNLDTFEEIITPL